MQLKRLIHFCALVLLALCVLGDDASCGEFERLQNSSDAVVVESKNGPYQTTYFDIPHQAPLMELPSEKLNDGDWSESQSNMGSSLTPESLRSLMLPKFAFGSEWITSSEFDLSKYDIRVTVPTYPFFGPPPPMISAGFAYTDLIDAGSYDLPDDLYEYSIGMSWIRPVRERWMIRAMLGVALATDNLNTSSDAWQFRGGVFAVYEPNERWQWVFGAIAIGRNDLPVVPAVGVIWQPRPDLKVDLTFPKPRFSKLIADDGTRQQWCYAGMGIGGGTWAYERADNVDDQLTYGDWRVVAGWESLPASRPGARFTPGRKHGLEIGYVFSRDLEFSSGSPDISFTEAVTLGITTRF